MARYIDADKLITHLNDEIKGCAPKFGSRAGGKSIAYGTMLGLKMAISFAETLSTADVVPKSEYDRLKKLFNDMTQEAKGYLNTIYGIRAEVAREIFEEIERFLYLHFRFCKEEIGNDDTQYVKGRLEHNTQMQDLIAELKKKYTEDNDG